MKKYSVEYKEFLYEDLNDKVSEKLGDKYKSLKDNILILLENTVEDTTELVNVQNFIDSYIKDADNNQMIGLIDDGDIFDFYLKCQSNIDELCNDKKFFDETPVSKNVFSLYGYVITGTMFAVKEALEIIQEEIF